MTESLSLASARRIFLAAQGMSARTRKPTASAALASLARTGVWQVDSVNVFARSHLMPWFSRNGSYELELFDELAWGESSELVEYIGHEATLMPRSSLPLFGWRMTEMRDRYLADGAWMSSQTALQNRLISQLKAQGPLTAGEFEQDPQVRSSPWWGWTDVKRALELMFRCGILTSVTRRGFRRVYALPEQVLDSSYRVQLPKEQAQYELIKHAVRALGVGTRADFADYFRMGSADTQRQLDRLQDEGLISPVKVQSWQDPSWVVHSATRNPGNIRDALLSPFDPIVWCRGRTERLFGMNYRIEIYTPAAKRQYGYYSLPVLVSGNLVGRIDLKADRKTSTLLVQSAWTEFQVAARDVAAQIHKLLRQAANWQRLEKISVAPVGNLASGLAQIDHSRP